MDCKYNKTLPPKNQKKSYKVTKGFSVFGRVYLNKWKDSKDVENRKKRYSRSKRLLHMKEYLKPSLRENPNNFIFDFCKKTNFNSDKI